MSSLLVLPLLDLVALLFCSYTKMTLGPWYCMVVALPCCCFCVMGAFVHNYFGGIVLFGVLMVIWQCPFLVLYV